LRLLVEGRSGGDPTRTRGNHAKGIAPENAAGRISGLDEQDAGRRPPRWSPLALRRKTRAFRLGAIDHARTEE